MNEQRNMFRRFAKFNKLLDRICGRNSVDSIKIVELSRDVILKKGLNQNKKSLEFGVREIFDKSKIKTAYLQNNDSRQAWTSFSLFYPFFSEFLEF